MFAVIFHVTDLVALFLMHSLGVGIDVMFAVCIYFSFQAFDCY
jgi:hypothetical protein